MKPEQKRRLKQHLITSMISAFITALFMYLFYYPGWRSIAAGLCIGGFVPLSLNLYSDKIYRTYLMKSNLLVALIINTLVHLFIIILIALLFVGIFYLKWDFASMFADSSFFFSKYLLVGVGFGLLLALGFNFFSILNTLIGKHILGKLFIGLYRQPREVDRVFMFLDIKSSTSIAENIGHLKFMSMVNDFFHDITEPVLRSKGEIYKYVGDEAIITWKTRDAVKNGNCVNCYINIREIINGKAGIYMRKYGIVPDFKAGLHGGFAVTGELGYTKREIAYMGDVLNTTARIEEVCKTFGESILISDAIVSQINKIDGFRFKEVGLVDLRGKSDRMKLFGIEITRSV